MHFSYQFGHFRRQFFKGFRHFGRLTLKADFVISADSTCLSIVCSDQEDQAQGRWATIAADALSEVSSSRRRATLPPPRRLSAASSPLGHTRGTLISTFSSEGGRLLPLSAARLRRHTLAAIRAGRRFPRPSYCLGAPSSPWRASAPHPRRMSAASHPRGCPHGALVSAAVPRPGDTERCPRIVATTVVRRRRHGRDCRSGLCILCYVD